MSTASVTSAADRFEIPVRVYHEDTDASGVVYHANYLKFMERARSDWLRSLGFDQAQLLANGVMFSVHRIELNYLQPALFNEALTATAMLSKLRKVGFTFLQTVERDGHVLVRADVGVACISVASSRPCAIPPELYERLPTPTPELGAGSGT